MQTNREQDDNASSSLGEIFRVALRLGLTSFGGPTAHLGYFREEYVVRRRWLDERSYADLVALCQFLPGPASSQVGIGIGTLRGGLLGGIAAWLGFTMPSAILLVAFAFGVERFAVADSGWLHGLEVAAVGGGGAGGLGDGPPVLHRSGTRDDRGRRGDRRVAGAERARPTRRHRRGRDYRLATPRDGGHATGRAQPRPHRSALCTRLPRPLLRPPGGVTPPAPRRAGGRRGPAGQSTAGRGSSAAATSSCRCCKPPRSTPAG